MDFNLFGPPTKDDIKVGYIDPTLGYVQGLTICEANDYAKNNPGTTFIFRDGNNSVQYININEVNNLTPNDLVSTANTCGGIQNYTECGPPTIQIYGGGGVGAVANPIIGADGSLLAVDVVSGGYGYQYPPTVTLVDDCRVGSGAVLTAVLGETVDQIEVYEGEEDFEEYEICDQVNDDYGIKYGPNGEELGPWDPNDYTTIGKDPIQGEIEAFQRAVQVPFWTTREAQPDRITVLGQEYATQESTFVTDTRWGEFMNKYAISPVKPSDTVGTDESGKIFQIEWEYNFPVSGEYIFRGVCDNVAQVYIDNSLVGNLKSFADNPSPLQKTIQEGNHIIRVDLLNEPVTESVTTTTTTKSSLTAKFIQKGTSYYLQVDGTGSGEISFVMDVNDSPSIAGLAAKEVRIPSDSGKVKFIRTEGLNSVNAKNQTIGQSTFVAGNYPTEETIKESGTFTGGKQYGPIEIIGADPGARGPIPIKDGSNKLALRDADGDDENIKITIEKVKGGESTGTIEVGQVISPKSWTENPVGVSMTIDAPTPPIPKEELPVAEGQCPPNPIWTTRFPNSAQQWYPVNYSGMKEFTQTSSSPVQSSETQEVVFSISASGGDKVKDLYYIFTSVDGQHTFTLNNVEDKKSKTEKIQIRKNVNYSVVGGTKLAGEKLEQGVVKSTSIFLDYTDSANDNDDMLVSSSAGLFTQGTKREVGGRTTYDLTYVLNSSANSTSSVITQTETPVQGPSWSEFFNRYAISPVPPLNTPGSDGSGIIHRNSWDIDIPYRGYYAFQVQRDNTARIYVDGNLAFDVLTSGDAYWIETGLVNEIKTQKVLIEKGRHTISIELENTPQNVSSIIETKVFSTQDWRSPATSSPSNITAKFIQKGTSYYLQVDGTGSGEISFVMDVNDSPSIAGLAAKEVRIPSDSGKVKFIRTEGLNSVNAKNQTIGQSTFVAGNYPTEETIKESGTFTGGKQYGPIEIIGADPGARGPIPIKDGSNKLALRDADGDDENIKITIEKVKNTGTSTTPGNTQSPTKDGVTYSGPSLIGYTDKSWSQFMNDFSVSPSPVNEVGTVILTWSNVNFPESGTYKFNFQADNIAKLTIGGIGISTTSDFIGEKIQYNFNITAGKYDIVVQLENVATQGKNTENNPRGVALYISKDITFTESNKTSWLENPVGISAILIPPPCAKKIGGKGVVEKIVPIEPGNGYPSPPPETPSYNVQLILTEIIPVNPGINYNCGVDQFKIVPDNGAKISYTCDTFGRITEPNVDDPGTPFTIYPSITVPSETGVNAKFIPVFTVVRIPPPELIGLPPDQFIQVTDLVGLKQTGYIDGKPYYGAIYYDNGIPYAGYYKTAGTQLRVYATLQESITAKVTTPPSAIQRSGTDIRSNDPRLNIPGTPQSTTQQQ